MAQGKKKFLFIQPDWHRHYVADFPVYEPLHGLLLGAIVKDLADTVLIDRRYDSDKNLIKILQDFKPDIIGTTTHTAGEMLTALEHLTLVKQYCPDAITIVGGQHATLLPEDFFNPVVDLVCIGPGEETFREVVEAIISREELTHIAGLAVRSGDEYIITAPRIIKPGLFSWPLFDRSLLRKYKKHYFSCFEGRPSIYTITTTGCPHRCKFCALWAAARGTYRRRIPEEIVRDIMHQPQTFVHLTDDNTFDNESHALEIYKLLKKNRVKKKILAYARADTIINKTDLIAKWCEVGLGALVVGMEGVTDKHLEYLDKRSSREINIAAHKVMESLRIENWAHFVMMPDFKKKDFDAIWEFVDEHNVTYPIFCVMTPVPGTPFFFEAKEQGRISTFDYGFCTLQYQMMKTDIPKKEWYGHLSELYRKSCSPQTLWKRRKSKAFNLRPAILRAMVMTKTRHHMQAHIEEQLEHERTFNYAEKEHTLPPSLRSDYKPVNYYNSPKMITDSDSAK